MAISLDSTPTLDVVPRQEEVLLREAVAGICSGFGPAYSQRMVEEGRPPTELWDALAERGYLGVNMPEEYGGGGLGMAALSMVGEEIAAAGCSLLLIVVSPAIAGSILARHGSAGAEGPLAARDRRGHHQDRVRDHRARRRHQLAQPLDVAARATASASCSTARRPTSPASRRPTPCWWWPRRATPTARSACPRWRSWTWTRRASPAPRSRCPTWAPTSSGSSSSRTSRWRRTG